MFPRRFSLCKSVLTFMMAHGNSDREFDTLKIIKFLLEALTSDQAHPPV